MSECSRLLWSNVYLFSDSVTSLDRQKNMNEVNRFLEEGILQAIRNLLPVKSILRDSLQDDDDDAIQINNQEEPDKESPVPPIKEKPVESLEPEVPTEPVKAVIEPLADLPSVEPLVNLQPVELKDEIPETLIIDTEKSVGFTGIDSVFGTSGEAELRPSFDESDELKIIGDLEELGVGDIEELDAAPSILTPLGADDYESL
jgi:hypothetical protein